MTPVAFCTLVENRLGYASRTPHPHHARHYAMAAMVKKKLAELNDPELYSDANLKATVELLRRERLPRNPLGVLAHVPRVVNLKQDAEVDLDIDIRAAIAAEHARGNPDGWVETLSRATGAYRHAALAEWKGRAS